MRTGYALMAGGAPPTSDRPHPTRPRVGPVAGFLLAIAAATAGCGVTRDPAPVGDRELPRALAMGTQSECLPRFPDRGGWSGGDAGASVALPGGDDRRSLWLFGDSFVAPPGAPAERAYPFVHNSIAISRCEAVGDWRIEYGWGGGAGTPGEGRPRAFFEPDPDADWVARVRRETGADPYYWPLNATTFDGEVLVALLRVAASPPHGPFGLPFRALGVDLARIANPDDPPESWIVRHATLSSRGDVLPASALVVSGGHLYAFAFLARGDGRAPRILTRIPLETLAQDPSASELEGAISTLAPDGRWLSGLVPDRARVLMDDDASEMSVHFDPGVGAWLAVYSDPTHGEGPAPSELLWLRRAPRLEGPWSEPVALLWISELAASRDALPGELFCYAGRAHPQFATSGSLLVTYVCNLFAESADEIPAVLERLRTTPSIYRPRAVRIALPKSAEREPAP